jgi:predicted transcriptional regulator of viral defense system
MGVFTLAQCKQFGVSQPTISRLAGRGFIKRLAPGVYKHKEAKIDDDTLAFSVGCSRFGARSIVGGLSALYYYGLVDNKPDRVWLFVPSKVRSSDESYRLIRTSRQQPLGIANHGSFRITVPERTLLEAFLFSKKIGMERVEHAAHLAMESNLVSLETLAKFAESLQMMDTYKRSFLPKFIWTR